MVHHVHFLQTVALLYLYMCCDQKLQSMTCGCNCDMVLLEIYDSFLGTCIVQELMLESCIRWIGYNSVMPGFCVYFLFISI